MKEHSPAHRNRNAPFLSVTLPRTPACARWLAWQPPTQARGSLDSSPTALCSFHDGKVFGSALPASHRRIQSQYRDRHRSWPPQWTPDCCQAALSSPDQRRGLRRKDIGTAAASSSSSFHCPWGSLDESHCAVQAWPTVVFCLDLSDDSAAVVRFCFLRASALRAE